MDDKKEVDQEHVELTCRICGEKSLVLKKFAKDDRHFECIECTWKKVFGEDK